MARPESWSDPETIQLLKAMRASNMSYAQIAKVFGVTRNMVAGAVARWIRAPHPPERRRPLKSSFWDEASLTETWAERKFKAAQTKAILQERA